MLKLFFPCVLLSLSSISLAQSLSSESSVIQSPSEISNTELPTTSNAESLVAPFTAQYAILHKSKKVGTGVRKLEKLTNNTYRYSYKTEIEWLIFDDMRSEESILEISNNQVIPSHYKYEREGTGRDKFYEWSYDVDKNTGTDLKKNKTLAIEFPDNIQDSLSYHLQHRFNLIKNPEQKVFNYHVIKSSGSIREYEYEYDGTEDIMLPYGLVKTIKLKREITEKERVTYAWFAPELNYLLVRLYQSKGGTEQFEAQLTSIVNQDKTPPKTTEKPALVNQ